MIEYTIIIKHNEHDIMKVKKTQIRRAITVNVLASTNMKIKIRLISFKLLNFAQRAFSSFERCVAS